MTFVQLNLESRISHYHELITKLCTITEGRRFRSFRSDAKSEVGRTYIKKELYLFSMVSICICNSRSADTDNNNSYSNCISNFANSVGKPVGVGVGVVSKGRNWYLIEDLQKLFISYFKSIFD